MKLKEASLSASSGGFKAVLPARLTFTGRGADDTGRIMADRDGPLFWGNIRKCWRAVPGQAAPFFMAAHCFDPVPLFNDP